MPVNIYDLQRNEKTIPVKYETDDFSTEFPITYKPGLFTPDVAKHLNEASAMSINEPELARRFLAAVMVRWDVNQHIRTDTDEELTVEEFASWEAGNHDFEVTTRMHPIDEASLGKFDVRFLTAIQVAILEDIRPNRKKK